MFGNTCIVHSLVGVGLGPDPHHRVLGQGCIHLSLAAVWFLSEQPWTTLVNQNHHRHWNTSIVTVLITQSGEVLTRSATSIYLFSSECFIFFVEFIENLYQNGSIPWNACVACDNHEKWDYQKSVTTGQTPDKVIPTRQTDRWKEEQIDSGQRYPSMLLCFSGNKKWMHLAN